MKERRRPKKPVTVLNSAARLDLLVRLAEDGRVAELTRLLTALLLLLLLVGGVQWFGCGGLLLLVIDGEDVIE